MNLFSVFIFGAMLFLNTTEISYSADDKTFMNLAPKDGSFVPAKSVNPYQFTVTNAGIVNLGNHQFSYQWSIRNNSDVCAVVTQQILRDGQIFGKLASGPFCPFVIVDSGNTSIGSVKGSYGNYTLGPIAARECRPTERCGY